MTTESVDRPRPGRLAPGGAPGDPGPRSWRERLRQTASLATNARRTLALVAQVDRRLLVGLSAFQLLEALSNIAIVYVGKQIVDAVVAAASSHARDATGSRAATTAVVIWVLVELGLVVARSLVQQLSGHSETLLRARLGLHVNLAILEKAANVSYSHFEDPEFINQMTQARREASTRPLDLVRQVLWVLRQAATLVGYAALLWSLGPWALAALVVTAVPPFLAEARFGRELFALQKARTQRNRQGFYLEQVLTTEQSVKEVKLFALARWLIDRYRAVHEGFFREERDLAFRRARAAVLLGLLSTAALYGTYVVIAVRAAAGAITLGAMTLYITVFRQGQSALGTMLTATAKMYEDNLFMTTLFDFLAVPDDEPDEALTPEAAALALASDRPPRVVFEHVSFRYPDAARDALTDINLTIEAGETLALVGRNGAGKTTLIKLLVGLYRPTAGRILIDGEDAAQMSAAALRRKIGVIFQDFMRFQFSAGDNVGVGWLPAREDQGAVASAVREAGAGEVVDRLPRGLDTPLGRAFGGDDLSVGQWQRIALARAFMRKSRIIVLDEPTAAMDAEAEHEIFQRFRDLKANRTALLITHRFSTVRMADRIVVFEQGRLAEEGSHAELLAANGRYATMFRLQAQGYEMEPAAAPPSAAE